MDNEDEGSAGTHNDNDEGDGLEDVEEESVGDISAKRTNACNNVKGSTTSKYPLGFTQTEEGELKHDLSDMEDTIKVGMALGYNMEGCQDTLTKIIADMGDERETKMVRVDMWILRQFDFASTSSRGRSGGCWMPTGLDIMFIAVYAPQSAVGKIDLWASLSRLIANWDGNVIVMGDFYEVREAGERYGSVFYERQADAFIKLIPKRLSERIDYSLIRTKITM
ncbi:RNA-directed DNA polymerase, eukaryota [Tanacetum coccineum]